MNPTENAIEQKTLTAQGEERAQRHQIEITVQDPLTGEPLSTTLRDLVQVVQDESESDDEVVAIMSHLLESGRVRRRRPSPEAEAA